MSKYSWLPESNTKAVPENKVPRQRLRRQRFLVEIGTLKARFGSGIYSWSEGMNRKIARSIARDLAKKVA